MNQIIFKQILAHFLPVMGGVCGIVGFLSGGAVFFRVAIVCFIIFYLLFLLLLRPGVQKKPSQEILPDRHEPDTPGRSARAADTIAIVNEKLQILPVLTEQLQEVIAATDAAANGLAEAFIGISRQAKGQVQAVQELFGNLSNRHAGTSSVAGTQSMLGELKNNFSTIIKFLDDSIEFIGEIATHLGKVNSFAKNIISIGETTNILALNATIEAVHAGEAGSGFKIIAAEIKNLANDSSKSVHEITGITTTLTERVAEMQRELALVRGHAKKIEGKTNELFGVTTTMLDGVLDATAGKMEVIAQDAANLSREIGNAVVSIQFQDITRQRIEHVIEPLKQLDAEIVASIERLAGSEGTATVSPVNDSRQRLMDRYTMESERDVVRKLIGNT